MVVAYDTLRFDVVPIHANREMSSVEAVLRSSSHFEVKSKIVLFYFP